MADPLWPNILPNAGSQVLYPQAAGMEKALADTEAERLLAIYGELPRDQWDPYRIAYRNLGYLAWAVGVNLWEDDWPEAFRRFWVANQWTYKYERGSLPGLKDFVGALQAGTTILTAEVLRAVRPPALTYPLAQVANVVTTLAALVPNAQYIGPLNNTRESYENEMTWTDPRPKPAWQDLVNYERAQYLQRFAQLRGYPYVARVQLPWLCFLGPHHHPDGSPLFQKNGFFTGPLWPLYTTNYDAGGNYTFTYTIWDRGVETKLTQRKIIMEQFGFTANRGYFPGSAQYDDLVILPPKTTIDYYCSEPRKYLGGGDAANLSGKWGIFLGSLTAWRTLRIPRATPPGLEWPKAQYQTILPGDQRIEILPEKVRQVHPVRKTEIYPRTAPMGYRNCYLTGSGLPRSNAWQFLYDRWYLFDPDRVPDTRKNSLYMGHCRFGIDPYTAEVLIKLRVKQQWFQTQTSGWLKGFMKPPTPEPINKLRRAVCASMALRDTVLIDTTVTRRVQVSDITRPDGRITVGQWVQN